MTNFYQRKDEYVVNIKLLGMAWVYALWQKILRKVVSN